MWSLIREGSWQTRVAGGRPVEDGHDHDHAAEPPLSRVGLLVRVPVPPGTAGRATSVPPRREQGPATRQTLAPTVLTGWPPPAKQRPAARRWTARHGIGAH